jgi:bifunctional pyridoxal-dependent enzyme with beta-cystathionase and maltose regulon repressor activities
MIESRGGKEDMRLKKSFRRLMEKGTQFLSPEKLSEHITSKELKVKSKGANIAGLQIADLIAHSVRRYAFKKIWKMEDGKQTFSDSIISILENGKFFTYKNQIIGYGLKKLP